jgi:hypothetical protein
MFDSRHLYREGEGAYRTFYFNAHFVGKLNLGSSDYDYSEVGNDCMGAVGGCKPLFVFVQHLGSHLMLYEMTLNAQNANHIHIFLHAFGGRLILPQGNHAGGACAAYDAGLMQLLWPALSLL